MDVFHSFGILGTNRLSVPLLVPGRNKTLLITAVLLLVIAGAAFFIRTKEESSLPQQVDFNYHIRPILVQKCYLCHGPDPSSRKGDLRLDTYEGATALTKEGLRAIDPEHTEKSLLLFRINHKDPDIMMPAPESNLTLTETERKLLEKWIEQGAEYKQHWAFIPESPSPEVKNYKGNPIDYFINKKLDEYNLDNTDEADKNSLIRRVSYLITGLPPTVKELEQFKNDESPDAYEKMIDRYLASPRYGERWARHWMDVVRYAETRGHEFDYPITGAWRYRDYLIRAFNQDLPYNKFVLEHLAGDLADKPRTAAIGTINESRLATMFYTMAEGTHSPVDIRKDEADRIDNMIDVTSKAFQGLTLSCSRCHDHKFDPISAKDYYSFYGVMEGTRFTPVPANQLTMSAKAEQLRTLKDSVRHAVWTYLLEKSGADHGNNPSFVSLNDDEPVEKSISANDTSRRVLADFSGSDLQGWSSEGPAFTLSTTLGQPLFTGQHKLTGLQEGLASSRKLSTGIFGALRSPDFVIDHNYIGVLAAGNKSSIRIIIDNFQLISFPIYGEMDQKVNTEKLSRFVFNVAQWRGHKAYIEILPGSFENHVFKMAKDAYVEVKYAIAYNKDWREPKSHQPSGSLSESMVALTKGKASDTDLKKINSLLRTGNTVAQSPELVSWLGNIQTMASSFKDSIEFYNGVTDGYGKNSRVFLRGSHTDLSSEPVKRMFLPAVHVSNPDLDVSGSGRLQLALSIADPKNPLTSRIMVNRIWHYMFGKGIVETVDNFGMQGKLPSHPELLDFLALQFREDGYSIKKTIRRILLSDAFKRSTRPSGNALKKDPSNIYLSHYPVRRLEAEAIRDAMLTVSGSLDTTMYGAPVPTHITSFMNGRGKPAKSGPIDGERRRSIYVEVRRNFLDPIMSAFDRPTPFSTFGKRTVTNVPSQSLIMLNDPFVVMMAGKMATELAGQKLNTSKEKIEWIYNRSFSRMPTKDEVADAETMMEQLKKAYVSNGMKTDVLEMVLWKDYIHAVFNLKEFIFLN
jgi:Protein of unknown function (DUF1553)/Protein of unknown function (DUF1549)/Planctomycete cytochrome C